MLCIKLSIRDKELQDVGLVELKDVKADFGSSGGKEGAQLCLQRVLVGAFLS